MKEIENIASLEFVLNKESSDWRRCVFEKTGIVIIPGSTEQYEWDMYSSCGYLDMAYDVETEYQNGQKISKSTTINSIAEFIEYIQSMDSYNNMLSDINFGQFTRAELFWAIYEKILKHNQYPNAEDFVFGLMRIEIELVEDNESPCYELLCDMSVCGCDQLNGIVINVTKSTALDEAVTMVARQIKAFRDEWDEEDIPEFRYEPEEPFKVPVTYDEILEARQLMQY